MRRRKVVFVDSGAWIALAITRDPLHSSALETWNQLMTTGSVLYTSVSVILETFTFLDRNAARDVAVAWKDSLQSVASLTMLDCTAEDVQEAWSYFERRNLHKLSAVDATSFVLMKKHGIRSAFSFDHHFASVGFRLLG